MSKVFFHGSKALFSQFDGLFHGTGEGTDNDFNGWFFCDTPWGSIKHVEGYLRDRPGKGLLYVCRIPDAVLIPNCERGWTDTIYGNQAYGVDLKDSKYIEIIEILPLEDLVFQSIKRNQRYHLDITQESLHCGPMSYLRVEEAVTE